VLGSNADAATRFGTGIDNISADLRKGLKQLHHVQHDFGKTLKADLVSLSAQCQQVCHDCGILADSQTSQQDIASIDNALATFSATSESLSTSIQRGNIDASEASRSSLDAKNSVQQSVRDWARGVSDKSTKMVDDVLEHQQNHLAMVSTVLGSTADLVDNVITTTRNHLASEAEAAERQKALAHQTAAAEIVRLRAQNDMLTRMLSDEKAKTTKLRTELVQNLTNMIVGFTDAQDASWTQAVGSVQKANEEGMGEMEKYGDLVEEDWEEKVGRSQAVEEDLRSLQGTAKKQRIDGQSVSVHLVIATDKKALGEVTTGVRSRLELFGQQTRGEASEHVEEVDGFCRHLDEVASDGMLSKFDGGRNANGSLTQSGRHFPGSVGGTRYHVKHHHINTFRTQDSICSICRIGFYPLDQPS
jgi:kinesin family protein 11